MNLLPQGRSAFRRDGLVDQGRLLLLCLAAALVDLREMFLVYGNDYNGAVAAARGVLDGMPHWRVYQARLLGPFLVRLISLYGLDFPTAYAVAVVGLLTGAGYLLFVVLRKRHGSVPPALAGFLAFHVLLTACFSRPWLYIWDVVQLPALILLNEFAVSGAPTWQVAMLCGVSLLNHESATFMAVWMMLDPMIKHAFDRRARWWRDRQLFDWRRWATGASLIVGGLLVIDRLRGALLKQEVGPSLFGVVPGRDSQMFVMLPVNVEWLTRLTWQRPLHILIPIGILACALFALQFLRRDPRRNAGLAMMYLAWLAAQLFTGLIFETRIYMALVPFVAMFMQPEPAGPGTTVVVENPTLADQAEDSVRATESATASAQAINVSVIPRPGTM